MAASYEYTIGLVDKISGPARTAATEITRLTSKLQDDAAAVAKLEKQIDNLNKAESVDIALMRKMQGELAAKRKALGDTGETVRKLVKAEQAEAVAAREAASGAGAMTASFGAVLGVAAALAAALAVLGGIVLAGAKLAIDAGTFKRQTLAALQNVTGTAFEAQAAFQTIRNAADAVGYAEAKAQKLGLSLLDAGVAQADLGNAIKSIAILEKVRGEEAANKLGELVRKSAAAGAFKMEGESLVGTGLKSADVIDQIAKRLGKSNAEVEALMKAGKITAADGIAGINAALAKGGGKGLVSFGDVVDKVGEKFSRLFEDVDLDPVIELVGELGSMLDSTSIQGEALGFMLTTAFSGLFAAARAALPLVKVGINEVIIVALKLYIAAKPLVAKVRELWASANEGGTLVKVITTFVDAVVVAALAVGALVAAAVGIYVAFAFVYTWLTNASQAVGTAIGDAFKGAWTLITSIFGAENAQAIALAVIDGMVAGITGGASRVVQALAGVGQAAVGGVKSVLGIASPSKVMAQMGAYTAEGFAVGVDSGADDARASVEAAVAPPALAPVGGGKGGGNVTIEVGGIVIQVPGSTDAKELAALIPAEVAKVMESIAAQFGGELGGELGGEAAS